MRPLPKKSNVSDLKDLRPISILPFLSKILEKIVYDQVVKFCESHDLLPELQSGFRSKRSTATALLDVVDGLLSNLDSGMGSILTLLDFSRAFDSINTSLLLSKLSFYGFQPSALRWFSSYLSGRFQKTVIWRSDGNHLVSEPLAVERGVPQGSILGPLLFIIYSSDIVNGIRNSLYHLYADDLQIYIPVALSDIGAAVDALNQDLDRVYGWAEKNCLILNAAKSKFMIIGTKHQTDIIKDFNPRVEIMGEPLELVFDARNLGLNFDAQLRFEYHVADVVRNCFYRLKVLYRIRTFISIDLRIRLCEALVLSKLNYCLTVYGPCLYKKTENLVQRVQNACARFCFPIPPRTHVTPFLNNSNLLKMHQRLSLFYACQLHDIIKYKQPHYLYQKLSWRYSNHRYGIRPCSKVLHIPRHRTAAFRGGFAYRASKCWNDIPPPIRSIASKFSFRKNYREYLMSQQKQT